MNDMDKMDNVEEEAEAMSEEIHVDEEELKEEEQASGGDHWKEEVKVAGEELLSTVKKLIHEANVRRIIIKNADGKTLFEIPLVFGVAGIALLPTLAAVGLVGALLTDCTITVIREEAEQVDDPETEAESVPA